MAIDRELMVKVLRDSDTLQYVNALMNIGLAIQVLKDQGLDLDVIQKIVASVYARSTEANFNEPPAPPTESELAFWDSFNVTEG